MDLFSGFRILHHFYCLPWMYKMQFFLTTKVGKKIMPKCENPKTDAKKHVVNIIENKLLSKHSLLNNLFSIIFYSITFHAKLSYL